VLGTADEEHSADATAQGTSLLLQPAAGSFAYAIYKFNTASELTDVSVSLTAAQTSEAYVGVANYTKSHWVFSGPHTSATSRPLTRAHNVSPLNNVFVVVVAPPGETVRVDLLQLNLDNAPPDMDLQKSADGPAPLVVDFDATASSDSDGTIVKYEWDWEDDGVFDEDTATTATAQHNYTVPGSYTARVRGTDDQGTTGSATVGIEVDVPENFNPVASVFANPDDGNAPLITTLDGSNSADVDGTIVNYEWDFETDGTFDASGAADTIMHTYTTPGIYTATLRVTDDDANTDTDTCTVNVHGWVTVVADSSAGAGIEASLLMVNGKPAIAYGKVFDLCYVHSTTAAGDKSTDWITPVVVDDGGEGNQVGVRPSLALIGGNPAISHYAFDLADLKYARSSTVDGDIAADWSTSITVDGTGNQGWESSLLEVQGNPAISSVQLSGTQHLRYYRSTTATGSSALDWTQIVDVDTNAGTGENNVLAIVNGTPAISYYLSGSADLRYVRSNTANGAGPTDWATPVTVLASSNVGQFNSLAVVAGNPAISFFDGFPNNQMRYVRSTTVDGNNASDWSQLVTVDGTANTGKYSSLTVIAGKPCIAYTSGDPFVDTNMELAVSSSATGEQAGHWSHSPGDTDGIVGSYTSLVDNNGHPAVAYRDETNNNLKYAIMY
jgi:PKD repeat protein